MRSSLRERIWYVLKLLLAGYLIVMGLYWTASGWDSKGGPAGIIPLLLGLWLARRIHAIEGIRAITEARRR